MMLKLIMIVLYISKCIFLTNFRNFLRILLLNLYTLVILYQILQIFFLRTKINLEKTSFLLLNLILIIHPIRNRLKANIILRIRFPLSKTTIIKFIKKILSSLKLHLIIILFLCIIRTPLPSLYFPQSFFPPLKQTFSICDYHHRVLVSKGGK